MCLLICLPAVRTTFWCDVSMHFSMRQYWDSTVLQYACDPGSSQRCIAHVVHHTASVAMCLRMRHTCSLLCRTLGACWFSCDTPRTLLEPRHVRHEHAIVLVVWCHRLTSHLIILCCSIPQTMAQDTRPHCYVGVCVIWYTARGLLFVSRCFIYTHMYHSVFIFYWEWI